MVTASPPGTSMAARAVKAFLWAVTSFGLQRFITFVGTLVLARILVPQDFGLVAAGVAIMTYFEMMLDLGVGSTVVYEQEEGISDRVHTAFSLNVALGALIAVGGALAAPVIARFFQAPDDTALFRFMFLYLFLRAAGQVPDAVLRRDLAFRRRMLAEVSRGGIRVAVAIPLAVAGMGAWSIVIGMVIGETVSTLVTWWAARFRPRWRLDRGALRALLTYGTSMLGVRVVSELSNNGDYLVVGNRLGPDELGIYSIAYRVPELILATVFWLYSMVAFPVYSKASATERGKVRRGMLRSLQLTTLFAFPAGVGLALVADDAIRVLFTETWAPAIGPMVLIALGFAASSVAVASSDVLPAVGRPGTLFAINAVLLPPMLIAMILAAPRAGLVGVAAVQLVATVVYLPILQHFVNAELGTRPVDVFAALGPATSAAVGVLALAWLPRMLVDPGVIRLIATVLAGIAGAVIGVLVGGRRVLPELRWFVSLRARS